LNELIFYVVNLLSVKFSVPILLRLITKLRRKNPIILLFLLLSVLSLSCTFYRGFTTYFNVIYLARQHLEIYEEGLQKEQTPPTGVAAVTAMLTTHHWLEEEYFARQLFKKRTGLSMPVAAVTKNATSTNLSAIARGNSTHLDSAIILGSKVLADPKPTKYVEDALFIIGKAQYYKNDFAGAKRKFNELLFKYPDTKYGSEVGMLMARTLMATNEFDTATAALGKVLKKAEQSGNKTDLSEAHKAYAELVLASTPDSLSLAAEELLLAEQGLNPAQASHLSYQRGELYFLDGKWTEAEKAFRQTIDKTPDAVMQGEAYVALGETLRREKKFTEAEQIFRDVLQKVRYLNSHSAAQYEYAYTLDLEAREAVQNDLRAVQYRLDHYPQVKSTYWVLDTTYRTITQAIMARSRFRQAEIYRGMGEYDSASHLANMILGTKDFSSSEMNDYVNDRIRALARFAEWKSQLSKIDSVELLLTKMRRPNFNMLENSKNQIHVEAEQKVLGSRWSPLKAPDLTPEEEKLVVQYEERIRKERSTGAVSVFSINFSDTSKYIDSIHYAAMHAHFELGRAYENFIEYSSAISEYQKALAYTFNRPDTAANNFHAQILYTWVELDHQLGNATERDSLISILTKNYGETVYAQQAGKEFAGINEKDSPGEIAYRNAYAVLKSSGLDNAKNALLTIIVEHKHEDVAARSLYTIGVAYEDKPRYDSAVVYYRRVMSEYPYSKYAEYLKPRMLFAMQQQSQKTPQVMQVQNSNLMNPPNNPNLKVVQDSVKKNTMNPQNPTLPNNPPPKKK